jgi:radical SAM superfamily enzyme YgiQ (UPF0313 family)
VKRLLLVSPLAPRSLLGASFNYRLPCLGLLRVAALTPGDWEVVILDERVRPIDVDQAADLVGITAMTCTVNRAYTIADEFRSRGVPVVMGGIHATAVPNEALRHCDSVVVGEAEELWPVVLRDAQSRRLRPLYRHPAGPPALDRLPPVNWDLYRPLSYLPVHFVETTRGCPLDCEFCAVTTFFGGRYRSRPLDDVLTELASLKPFDGYILKNVVFFVDDNIISNRAYARALLERIAHWDIRWLAHASVNLARDEGLLKLCQRSGCMGVLIGFETLSAHTMRSIGRKSRLSMDYLDAIRRIHDHGIGIDGSFVFGFDNDDESVFDRTLEFVLRAKVEAPYFSVLTPYPGTRLHARLASERRILSEDWSLYDTSHVVIQPRQLTADQLQQGYFRVFREAYSKEGMNVRLKDTSSSRHFFVPMNFGFRDSIEALYRHDSGSPVERPLLATTANLHGRAHREPEGSAECCRLPAVLG